jgi:hypothetical protein
VKNKQTYRRFNGMAFLAGAGCLAVLLFEAFFIFELYDHFPELTERIPFIRSERPPEPPLPAKEPVAPPAPVEKEPAEAVPVG